MIYQRNFRVSHRVKNPQYVRYTKALILPPFKLHRIGSTYELGQPQWKKVPPKLIEQRIKRRFFLFVRNIDRQCNCGSRCWLRGKMHHAAIATTGCNSKRIPFGRKTRVTRLTSLTGWSYFRLSRLEFPRCCCKAEGSLMRRSTLEYLCLRFCGLDAYATCSMVRWCCAERECSFTVVRPGHTKEVMWVVDSEFIRFECHFEVNLPQPGFFFRNYNFLNVSSCSWWSS